MPSSPLSIFILWLQLILFRQASASTSSSSYSSTTTTFTAINISLLAMIVRGAAAEHGAIIK
jgi:hypothetical protein